jgi:hypothetical protein
MDMLKKINMFAMKHPYFMIYIAEFIMVLLLFETLFI